MVWIPEKQLLIHSRIKHCRFRCRIRRKDRLSQGNDRETYHSGKPVKILTKTPQKHLTSSRSHYQLTFPYQMQYHLTFHYQMSKKKQMMILFKYPPPHEEMTRNCNWSKGSKHLRMLSKKKKIKHFKLISRRRINCKKKSFSSRIIKSRKINQQLRKEGMKEETQNLQKIPIHLQPTNAKSANS